MKLPFNERFLQFVWQYQYFSHNQLISDEGESIEIIHPGYKNKDGGPDFINAKIKIGSLLWVGSVEIHTSVAGWNQHKHHENQAYNNVILHVVYLQNEKFQSFRNDGSKIPTLELKELIPNQLIEKGNQLFENIAPIPCAVFLSDIDSITLVSTLDRMLMQRLEKKAGLVLDMFTKNQNDWEETCYQLISQHLGMKVNGDAFLRLSTTTPLKLILKIADKRLAIEALLFGQAGFLEHNVDDDYHRSLRNEYQFLRHKFNLSNQVSIHEWKHLRLRPHNFPEIRITELASLYHKVGLLHAKMIEIEDVKEIRSLFKANISAYWQTHYGFGKPS